MRFLVYAALGACVLAGCARQKPEGFQGYLEGDYIYVASPLSGRIDTLAVRKGDRVEAGTTLFTLERASELAAQRQAADQLAAAQARLADLKKGVRPTELETIEARRRQVQSAAELARLEFNRQETLFKDQVISAAEFDRARLALEQSVRAVEELDAQLATARLGSRADVIAAAEAEVSAAAAAKDRADWNVDQKSQAAAQPGLVYDTLYRAGEFANAGNPVVVLLPPENIKVRFFVPEPDFAALKAGGTVQVTLSGHPAPLTGRISYLSPQPEYTPPVLYNRDNRAKLVFMIEATLTAEDARDLHPGQPVDVAIVR